VPVVRAVDVSGWTGEISPAAWQSMRSSGIELAIIQGYGGTPGGLGPNPHAKQQSAGASDAGIQVAAYSWPPAEWRTAFLAVVVRAPVSFVALDVEAGVGVTRLIVAQVKAAGLRPVIYASVSTWSEIMNDVTAYADVPLWDAGGRRYHGAIAWPATLEEERVPYGGWDRRIGWQWHGTTPLFGASVDLSIFDREFVFGQEVDMPRLLKKTTRGAVYVVTGDHLEHIYSPDQAAALGYDLTTVEVLPDEHPVFKLGAWYADGVPVDA
jgi:hypothetical protein